MVRVNQVVKDKVSICGDWNLWKAVFVVDLSFSVHFHQSCFQNKWLVVSAHTVGIHFYYRLIWTVAWYLVGVIIWQLDGCDNIWLIAVLNLDACISLSSILACMFMPSVTHGVKIAAALIESIYLSACLHAHWLLVQVQGLIQDMRYLLKCNH